MYFDDTLGIQERTGQAVVAREAVRGIVLRNGRILMVQSERGDYKLPGGGVEQGEGHHQALAREIAEETGYQCLRVGDLIGRVVERRPDKYDPSLLFEMTSYYYLCAVAGEAGEQRLDEYERDMRFTPAWISIPDALAVNRAVLENLGQKDLWTRRENHVLLALQRLVESGVDLKT
ncbi:MAG: NUDIX domain-containing protein [Limnochordia bacterium]|jgi:8-oxo-dGTP pyrophosphatase MutT (NUDIX family)|nr:NUDIX domain-containing protein [Bacillota bacterium]HOB09669.1 NUDIX domain-containing protein [Limnochordia bacterium]NLH30332.1 NUDIX domain-containing protein [Bacillota bacterium]HPT93453.1 NUDIX domain-containing protein [Limnochordia bacterium]HPZ31580.1 NUDIX domain-containing protein [Limnochordia bacterium]